MNRTNSPLLLLAIVVCTLLCHVGRAESPTSATPPITVACYYFGNVWIHHVAMPELQTDYRFVRDGYCRYWDQAERMFDVPYLPNVTMG